MNTVGRWLAERAGRLEYHLRPRRGRRFGGPFNGQAFRRRIFGELTARIPFVAVVETGTDCGTTTAYMREALEVPIHSFEKNPRHYGYAAAHLRGRDVHLHRGDSRAGLAALATSAALPAGPVLFYLDAHGCGELPLAEELRLVFARWPEAVAMVDDFAVADDPGYRFDDFGQGRALTLAYLTGNGVRPEGIWFPRCPAATETGLRRGSVVLAAAEPLIARIDTMTTLRRWVEGAAPAASA